MGELLILSTFITTWVLGYIGMQGIPHELLMKTKNFIPDAWEQKCSIGFTET